ncbi:gamma subclass chorismate mutase AroQ [Actinoplanes sp. TBRC 11911]|uniref:gamma subclass chorismate mutase AroQ n=1 Tax=Actinoplanes sp. TBRC 11911 TaxID=2729386 RepID=UPI001B7D6B9A|nr:gamma subclass chorismate mutase AroQ [Actinoplanes sp. TBRC 11911]
MRLNSGLDELIALAVERLALGDEVAAAKYGGATPISDGGREEQLLSDVVARSREIGLDPDLSARFFRAQIEANKVVQRRLYDLWSAHPELRPARRPDLEAEVRPRLDDITRQMLLRLKGLPGEPTGRTFPDADRRLDELHADALRIALAPIRDRLENDLFYGGDNSE